MSMERGMGLVRGGWLVPLVAVSLFTGCARDTTPPVGPPIAGVPFTVNYRSASVVAEPSIFVSGAAGQSVIHVVYASDEFCADHGCGVTNIVFRSSLDGYAARHDVTTSTTASSTAPRVVVRADGTVVVVYASREQDPTTFNLAMRIAAKAGADFGARVDLTTGAMHDVDAPSAVITSSGVIHVAYDSREYCDAHACDHSTIAVRTSADAFAARRDVSTDLACDASQAQLAVQGTSEIVHAIWSLAAAGSCTAADGNTRYATSSDGYLAATRFVLATPDYRAPAALAVQRDGTATIFFITYGSWQPGGICADWQFMYTSSASGFTKSTSVPGSCPEAWGYPDAANRPSVIVDSADVIHLAYLSAEGLAVRVPGRLVYRSSSDGFASALYASTSVFATQATAVLAVEPGGALDIAAVSPEGPFAGLNVYRAAAASGNFTRALVSRSLAGDALVSSDDHGGMWLTQLSNDQCARSGACSSLNWSTRSLATNLTQDLTHLTDNRSELAGGALVVRPSGALDFFYDSNEGPASGVYNIAHRRSEDSFATLEMVSSETTRHSQLGDAAASADGTLHVASQDGQGFVGYATSLDWTKRVDVAGANLAGFSPQLVLDRVSGDAAITYGGNQGGAWGVELRGSTDGFAATWLSKGGNSFPYGARDATFSSSGDLYVLYASLETVPTVYNLVIRKRSDNYASAISPFVTSDPDLLGACIGGAANLRVDSAGVIHLLYASRERGADHCSVTYRSSSDWTKSIPVSGASNGDAAPAGLFLFDGGQRVACYKTGLELGCHQL